MTVPKDTRERYEKLKASINRYRRLFHVHDQEEISEEARDSLMRELTGFEKKVSGADHAGFAIATRGGRTPAAIQESPA